ncbi:MAG: VWA domain-containing protein [Planctomycetota bacterium]
MSVHFAYPLALILLGVAVPTVLWARRSIAGLGRLRGGLALALRLAILALLILALAGAHWTFNLDDMSVIYVLDQSLSIPPEARKQALEFVYASQAKRREHDSVGLIIYGGTAALERRPGLEDLLVLTPGGGRPDAETPGERASLQSVISPERTNTAAALRLALAAFPAAGRRRIVLASDGNENVDSATEEAELARRNGVRVDCLPVRYEYDNEVMVEKVLAPPTVEKGAGFEVRVVADARHDQAATLRIYENATLIASQEVQLAAGRNVYTVQRKLPEPGYYSYTAVVESPADTLYANNEATGFTVVRGQGRILYVEGDPEHAGDLERVLTAQGLDVKRREAGSLPMPLGEIVANDVLILSNVPASRLGEEGMRAVELAVKDWGVGLVMIGGEDSFGPGGYQDSPVERALPVSMEIRQRRVMPSGALVIILHTCEIPQGNYWAQEIAKAALRVLGPSDEYGVLYYDWQGGVKWLFELQRVEDKNRLARLIGSVQPGDMPDFIPAFKSAHEALAKSTASIKHVVVISDGDPQYPSDAEVVGMVDDGITVSAVGISPHSQFDTNRLAYVASIGKGRYYQPASSTALPQIFIKEAATVRRSLIFEETFTPRVADVSELLKGIAPNEIPPLQGYVLTTGRDLAEIPLVSAHDDPVLAHWQYGLGRTVAFTSDAKARWAAQWLSWEKFGPFWAQVVRWSSRSVDAAGIQARTDIVNDRGRILIDAIDREGKFVNDLRFTSVPITPDSKEIPLDIQQTGPGRYEAGFDARLPGTHYLSLSYTNPEGKTALFTQGITVPYSAEYRELSANLPKLEALAAATDGRMLAGDEDVFARTFKPTPRLEAAWPLLLVLAILLVPVDVFVRRVFVDYRALWAKALVALSWLPVIGAPARRRMAAQPTHVGVLLSRKRATREELARRAAKFEAAARAREPAEPALAAEPEDGRPPIKPAKPAEIDAGGPAVTRPEDTFMGRLLSAKRKARKDLDSPEDEKKPT